MNDPEKTPIDIGEMRDWAGDYRARHNTSWSAMARESGIPAGTLQPFVKGNYAGDNERIARDMFKFRQLVESRARRAADVPADPGFFETPTSNKVEAMLQVAQMGRMTMVATGPGTGKTFTLRRYQAGIANVWVSTMAPSTRGVNNMQMEVLESMGEHGVTGTPQKLTRLIRQRVANAGGLIVLDEAQNLTEQALEEIRGWHDATEVGICLLGNEELLFRVESGRRRDAYARLNSRLAHRLIQNFPTEGDGLAFCDAWGIMDPAMRAFTVAVCTSIGGLREAKMMVEGASLIASSEQRPVRLADMKEAQQSRSVRLLAA